MDYINHQYHLVRVISIVVVVVVVVVVIRATTTFTQPGVSLPQVSSAEEVDEALKSSGFVSG